MCLAIPGQVLEVVDEERRLAKVDVAGVRRNVNIGLLDEGGEGVEPGDWVLIHVGFALSKVDEEEARRDPPAARGDGRRLRAGARGAEGERDRVRPGDMEDLAPHCDHTGCITCGDEAVPVRVLRVDEAASGLALCVDAEARREHRRDGAGRAGDARRPAARARGDGDREGRMTRAA